MRSDGKDQVTYNGHPLYFFAEDNSSGDTKGQHVDAFGAEWYVVAPSGAAIEKTAKSSGSGGYGY
jgi:predicted lipoprotein with Yx(FWY)xxD motif